MATSILSQSSFEETRGRKPKFRSGVTKVVRVPERFSDVIENIAKALDDGDMTLAAYGTDTKPTIDLQGCKIYKLHGKEVVRLEDLAEWYHLQRSLT